jgi:hypothetical protein
LQVQDRRDAVSLAPPLGGIGPGDCLVAADGVGIVGQDAPSFM